MLVSDITSPSISGHHRISLNEGNILLEPPLLGLLLFVLLLLLLAAVVAAAVVVVVQRSQG